MCSMNVSLSLSLSLSVPFLFCSELSLCVFFLWFVSLFLCLFSLFLFCLRLGYLCVCFQAFLGFEFLFGGYILNVVSVHRLFPNYYYYYYYICIGSFHSSVSCFLFSAVFVSFLFLFFLFLSSLSLSLWIYYYIITNTIHVVFSTPYHSHCRPKAPP